MRPNSLPRWSARLAKPCSKPATQRPSPSGTRTVTRSRRPQLAALLRALNGGTAAPAELLCDPHQKVARARPRRCLHIFACGVASGAARAGRRGRRRKCRRGAAPRRLVFVRHEHHRAYSSRSRGASRECHDPLWQRNRLRGRRRAGGVGGRAEDPHRCRIRAERRGALSAGKRIVMNSALADGATAPQPAVDGTNLAVLAGAAPV